MHGAALERCREPRARHTPARGSRSCQQPLDQLCVGGKKFVPSPYWALGEALLRHQRSAPRLANRKSTRLNSSHLVISYAVFCLKKKKKTSRRSSQSSKRVD